MAYEIKEATFSLFPNESDNPQAPRMKGKGMWKGELIEFAVWTKESDNVGKYFTGKIQMPREQAPSKPAAKAPADEGADDIPF